VRSVPALTFRAAQHGQKIRGRSPPAFTRKRDLDRSDFGAAALEVTTESICCPRSRAQFDAPEGAVHIRVAEHAGHIYLDLPDEHWRAVEIGPDGWHVIGCPPVRFRRPPGMLPLPMPEQGASIEALNSFLNLSSPNDFVLIVAWLLAALRPRGPYPLLASSVSRASLRCEIG
jgi:hypothetical protein